MLRKNNYFFISMALLLLSGCAAHQALQDMKQSKAAYQACLAASPKNPSACKHEKDTYEAAGEAYESLRP